MQQRFRPQGRTLCTLGLCRREWSAHPVCPVGLLLLAPWLLGPRAGAAFLRMLREKQPHQSALLLPGTCPSDILSLSSLEGARPEGEGMALSR